MAKIDLTKYAAMVANAASKVKISSTVFKDFIGDVKNVVDSNSPDGQYAADAGSTDAYAITLSPAPTAYFTGMMVRFKANTVNTGAATLNVNGLGAKTIKKNTIDDLSNNDITANQIVNVVFDGTNFQLVGGFKTQEGTFTPVLRGTTVVGVNTYTNQSGYYVRNGNQVTVWGRVKINVKDAAMSGTIQIIGLPFLSKNQTDGFASVQIGYYATLSGLANGGLSGYISPNTDRFDLVNLAPNTMANVVAANILNGTDIMFSATYQI